MLVAFRAHRESMLRTRVSPICPDMLFGRDSFLNVYRGDNPRETDDRASADPARRDQRVACACGPPELARHGVLVMSPEFAGKSRVDRHRLVNDTLAAELKGQVHALAIQAYAPGEEMR